jgi:hypothetical protein
MWTAGHVPNAGEGGHHGLPSVLMRLHVHRAARADETLLAPLTHAPVCAKIGSAGTHQKTAWWRSAAASKP